MFTVLFDSGIRTGSDVIKAIAMGAQGVLVVVGRPIMYGLALGGEEGVEEVLRALLADTEITLGLCGYRNIDEIWGKRETVLEKADSPHRCAKL
jgi:isopentenyl diphosphate isomerase/L-lactate dehydrogenase-like FMN-dependent dehydrogenase